MKRILCSLVVFTLLALPQYSFAELQSEPGKLVQTVIQTVRQTLSDKKGKIPETELNSLLEKQILPVFDFEEMSRRSLGRNWKKATDGEQEQFVALFSDLISHTYLERIKQADRADISFVGESVETKRALIKTLVIDQGDKFPINYRLRLKAGEWRAYDVVIENISLVSNYRNEFAGIVRKERMTGLIERLKEKKAKRDQKPAEKEVKTES